MGKSMGIKETDKPLRTHNTVKLAEVGSLRVKRNSPTYAKFDLHKVSRGTSRACTGVGQMEKAGPLIMSLQNSSSGWVTLVLFGDGKRQFQNALSPSSCGHFLQV